MSMLIVDTHELDALAARLAAMKIKAYAGSLKAVKKGA